MHWFSNTFEFHFSITILHTIFQRYFSTKIIKLGIRLPWRNQWRKSFLRYVSQKQDETETRNITRDSRVHLMIGMPQQNKTLRKIKRLIVIGYILFIFDNSSSFENVIFPPAPCCLVFIAELEIVFISFLRKKRNLYNCFNFSICTLFDFRYP